jgi:iron complex outermembrane receptor protein
MRFLTGCLLIAFLLGAYTYSDAQTNIAGIHGKVTDDKHIAADAATVILLAAADSSIIKSTACDADGMFKINAKPGKYLLLITKIGFDRSLTGPYVITGSKDLTVKAIALVPFLLQIKEVSINAKRPYYDVKLGGKIVLNLQSNINADGKSISDILKDEPLVHSDGHGNFGLIGHQAALVTIDGKPTNLTGQDLNDYLQSMAGNSIQQLELIPNPSAKYEAAAGGIINLISKKGENAGTNFVLTANAGYGKYYKAATGLNFNSRVGIVNVFGGYNYLEDKSFHEFTTQRYVNYNSVMSEYDVNYNVVLLKKSNTFRIGTDIAVSPKHTIGLLMSGTVDNYNNVKDNYLNISNQGNRDSVILTTTNIDRGQSNLSYDINYNGKLDDKGKALSADFVYNNINRHSAELIDNRFLQYLPDGSRAVYRPELYLQNLSPSAIHIWAAKLDYVSPISKTSQLETGIKYSDVESKNDLIFGPKVNGVYTASAKESNTFTYSENINSAYLNYANKIDKVNLTVGLRAEQTISKGYSLATNTTVKKNYIDWFPQLQLDYQADEKNMFSISYNRGVARPKYIDVNPFLYYVGLYDYSQGNPNLKPQYTNKIEVAHSYNKTFATTLSGTVITDYYDLRDITQNDTTKISVTTAKNFGTYSVLGLRFIAQGLTFNRWWSADFALDASYQRTKAYAENGNLNKGTQDIIVSGRQYFKLSNTFRATISGKYESPTFYGIGQFKSNYAVDAAVSKQILENGIIRLSVSDIFNTHRDRSTINYQNLSETIYNKDETRVVRLGFTYRFGNISLKGTKKHAASNEDEQNRAGGVAGSTPQNNLP